MLALGIFVFLLLIIGIVAVWYYYRWTPEGILKDLDSNYRDTEVVIEATKRAQRVHKATQAIDQEAYQKFNPVKNLKGSLADEFTKRRH